MFVCVHKAGRTQMAAALASSLSRGRVHVRSAGSSPVGEINPVVIEVLAIRGIDLVEAYSKPLTDQVVRAADVIITVRDIRDDLIHRVTGLLRDLAI